MLEKQQARCSGSLRSSRGHKFRRSCRSNRILAKKSSETASITHMLMLSIATLSINMETRRIEEIHLQGGTSEDV